MVAVRDGAHASLRGLAGLYEELRASLGAVIVGQDEVVEQTLVALLSEGHVLIVGVPGLAKTLLVSTVAEILGLTFRRIQFTPDLMPSDITGTSLVTEDLASGQRAFRFRRGPVFSNIVLADEINRTPPKTQAALMEAMEERQVTHGGRRIALDRPFFVLATQNPIEQEGTYPLPVSQLDRFLFNIFIDYPTFEEEYAIMYRTTSSYAASVEPRLNAELLGALLDEVRSFTVPPELFRLVNELVRSTRPQERRVPEYVREYVSWGAGPRAAQALLAACRARAALHGRQTATREDLRAVWLPALRHRLVMTYHAQAERVTPDDILKRIAEPHLHR